MCYTLTVGEELWKYAAIARCNPYMGVWKERITDRRCEESRVILRVALFRFDYVLHLLFLDFPVCRRCKLTLTVLESIWVTAIEDSKVELREGYILY